MHYLLFDVLFLVFLKRLRAYILPTELTIFECKQAFDPFKNVEFGIKVLRMYDGFFSDWLTFATIKGLKI